MGILLLHFTFWILPVNPNPNFFNGFSEGAQVPTDAQILIPNILMIPPTKKLQTTEVFF